MKTSAAAAVLLLTCGWVVAVPAAPEHGFYDNDDGDTSAVSGGRDDGVDYARPRPKAGVDGSSAKAKKIAKAGSGSGSSDRDDGGVVDLVKPESKRESPRKTGKGAKAGGGGRPKHASIGRSGGFVNGFLQLARRPDETAERDKSEQRRKKKGDRRANPLAEKTTTTTSDDSAMATTVVPPASRLYNTEAECTSANGGVDCVCDMADARGYFEPIVRRLRAEDESRMCDCRRRAVADDLKCHRYRFAPAPPTGSLIVARPAAAQTSNTTDETPSKATDTTTEAVNATATEAVNATTTQTVNATTTQTVNTTAEAANTTAEAANTTAGFASPRWKPFDFESVLRYRLKKSRKSHHSVKYGLVGGDISVDCRDVEDSDDDDDDDDDDYGNETRYKWTFSKKKHNINSTVVVGMNTSQLVILGLKPEDSHNYTCTPTGKRGYTHNVLAVRTPIFAIRFKNVYKAMVGACDPSIVGPVQLTLSDYVQKNLCPVGSVHYPCDVAINAACTDDKRTLTIDLSVALSNLNGTRIAVGHTFRRPLLYQQFLAQIVGDLAGNLQKTLTFPITSKLSLIDTGFQPVRDRMTVDHFVSCGPGFGIREVFCAACAPNHYSPNAMVDCLPCPKGYHQPVAGSAKCSRCPHDFAYGCFKKETTISKYAYWIVVSFLLIAFLVIGVWTVKSYKDDDLPYVPLNESDKNDKKFKVRKISDDKMLVDIVNSKKNLIHPEVPSDISD